MKGIILAGGSGTRLMPLTLIMSKQVLPVYDKPLIYYPLSILMQMGIREILIISTPRDIPIIQNLLGTGENIGISFSYKAQPKPEGIAQSFIIGEDFIGGDKVCLILGDNIYYGRGLHTYLKNAMNFEKGGCVLAYHVKDPERYGVVEFDERKRAVNIEEKPKKPKSSYAITGLYCYDNEVISVAKNLKPSVRGELEITDVSNAYLKRGLLSVEVMGRGMAWLDAGTPESLLAAAQFIKTVEDRQGLKIGCIEEVAFQMGYINEQQFNKIAESYGNNSYGNYLREITKEGRSELWLT